MSTASAQATYEPYTITTLAGLAGAFGSADGTGSAARFYYPYGVAVDSAGHIYVADTNNDTIRAGTPAQALTLAAAASRKVHGSAGTFDVNLPLSGSIGVECRTGGANGNHTFVITFSNTVTNGNATVTSGTGSVAGPPAFSGTTMTVNLTGVANAQTVTVTLSNVIDSFHQVLPNTAISAGFLLGDTNGDRFVNGGDSLQTRNRAGQATDATNFRSDVNADGFVNSGDTFIVRSRSGTFLP